MRAEVLPISVETFGWEEVEVMDLLVFRHSSLYCIASYVDVRSIARRLIR